MRRPAMDEFLRRYLPALRAHVVARGGAAPDVADDLVQGFVCSKLLERNLLGRVGREGGRFRTFLLTTLDRYVIDQRRAERARAGRAAATASVEDADAPASAGDPSTDFDAAWARAVVAQAVWWTRAECEAAGRPDVWQVFRCRVLDPAAAGGAAPAAAELAARLGVRSPTQVSNLLVTAKRMFRRNLRRAVAEYALDEDDAEEEMRLLLAALGRSRTPSDTPRWDSK